MLLGNDEMILQDRTVCEIRMVIVGVLIARLGGIDLITGLNLISDLNLWPAIEDAFCFLTFFGAGGSCRDSRDTGTPSAKSTGWAVVVELEAFATVIFRFWPNLTLGSSANVLISIDLGYSS
jgi:hypothetical protein